MPEYTIVIHVEPKALVALEEQHYFLCMSQAVSGATGEPDYNVVALAAEVTPKNTIKFTTKYSIYGTKQTFKVGQTTGQGDAIIRPIEFGQGYVLKSWSDSKVVTTDKAPPGGFAFLNDIQAAAVVSLQQGPTGPGSKDKPDAPIYISSQFVPGTARLTPITQVCLWFQQNVVTSTMVSVDVSKAHVINLTGRTEASTTYTNDFKWKDPTMVPGSADYESEVIDYTKITAAKATPDAAFEKAAAVN
ncbi:hypothetical protein CPB83DRAFT_894495 [Crepidotus variabilis]|uniref:Uncharacterized protein n=1 Tax=Crepidotus variabilis TaxID=179855 RepID=A0A9P6JPW2_9AGAR|nr:hypothetical protein CPB83DRAFT_894495 [Crepidotus variabilis]